MVGVGFGGFCRLGVGLGAVAGLKIATGKFGHSERTA